MNLWDIRFWLTWPCVLKRSRSRKFDLNFHSTVWSPLKWKQNLISIKRRLPILAIFAGKKKCLDHSTKPIAFSHFSYQPSGALWLLFPPAGTWTPHEAAKVVSSNRRKRSHPKPQTPTPPMSNPSWNRQWSPSCPNSHPCCWLKTLLNHIICTQESKFVSCKL